jgi:beta-lactamase superfamily II metal-dependent hydrolase
MNMTIPAPGLLIWILALCATPLTAAKNLDVYVIDAEGGKAVLLVSPTGQSMLVDAGWPAGNNRPASTDRIVEAARAAGVKRIDHLVITHFDIDHIGDVPDLISKIPVGHFYDHGDLQTTNAQAMQRFATYAAVRGNAAHTVLKINDRIPIEGVDVQVVSAGGQLITKPLAKAGMRNTLCGRYQQAEALASDAEDDRSVGLLITLGKFRMLDLADLEAHLSHDLVCPVNLIGKVSVYNVNVHGQFKGIAPELVGALEAPVIIQANGARKGADAKTWSVLRNAPGLKDIWQLHFSLNAGKDGNPPEDFVANLEGNDGFKWIRISAEKSGTFTVTNTRNEFSKTYGR